MRKKQPLMLSVFWLVSLFLLSGCQQEMVSREKQTFEGGGLTYEFQLPNNWKSIDNYQDIYGTSAVYGAEDTRSKSGVSIVLFPAGSADENDFGEKTRKELAQANGYKKVEDVYMKKYEVDGAPAYKYTFQTKYKGKKTWAHYYAIFSDNGIIQLLFYSVDDTRYTERVKEIDASVETVRETAYDASKAAEADAASKSDDQIELTTDNYIIQLTGLATTAGEGESRLLVLRYEMTNRGELAAAADSWADGVTLFQQDRRLELGALPSDNTSYDLLELVQKGTEPIEPGKTGKGVVLYELVNKEPVTLQVGSQLVSDESEYQLLLP